jgi:hypothetical protein
VTAASAILARLNAIGARVECRGDRVVIRAGRRPVPRLLIEEARKAKAELAETHGSRAHARGAGDNDDHLRPPEGLRAAQSLASDEDAHPKAFDEHVRQSSPSRSVEDAHSYPAIGASNKGHHRALMPVGGDAVADEYLQAEHAAPTVKDSRLPEDHEDSREDVEHVRRGQDDEQLPAPRPEDAHLTGYDEHLPQGPGFLRIFEEAAGEDARHLEPPPARASQSISVGGHAASIESAGGVPPAWSEGAAQLDPNRPPADVPPQRWKTFVDDVSRFIDSPLCAVAEALGWGPCDLFGCDRDRPFARIDQAGLFWLINGDRLVMLTDDAATIETRTGMRQTWRRKLGEPSRIPAWELA